MGLAPSNEECLPSLSPRAGVGLFSSQLESIVTLKTAFGSNGLKNILCQIILVKLPGKTYTRERIRSNMGPVSRLLIKAPWLA